MPERGGAILASNHLAVVDSFFLPLLVPRRITFLAKREYFTQPGLVGRLKKIFFTGVGQVPIDRSGGSAAQAAMDTAVRCCARASCWASTRRAPARRTGGCTRARPASPG